MIKKEIIFTQLKSDIILGQGVKLELPNGDEICTSAVEDFYETKNSLKIITRNSIYLCYNHTANW